MDKYEDPDTPQIPSHPMDTSAMSTTTKKSENSFVSVANGEYATDQLERCGKWLSSVPRDDITVLRHTDEFKEFLKAFERLGQAHIRVVLNNQTANAMDTEEIPPTQIPPTRALSFDTDNSVKQNAKLSNVGKMASDSEKNKTTTQSDVSNESNSQRDASHAVEVDIENLRGDDEAESKDDQPHGIIVNWRQEQGQPGQVAVDPYRRNGKFIGKIPTNYANNNFLRFTDDVLLRIFEFLRSHCLIQTSITCSRFHQLARRSATQRTYDVVNTRQLGNVMKLLRAREQLYYVDENNANTNCHVPVPTLLPSRRILVNNSGDPEYNGVYYCTECHINGFKFTKPRFSPYQMQMASHQVPIQNQLEDVDFDNLDGGGGENNENMPPQQHRDAGAFEMVDQQPAVNNNDNNNDQFQPQRQQQRQHQANMPNDRRRSGDFEEAPLRCMIAKVYSNSDLLWYMSKEVETIARDDDSSTSTRKRKIFYSFYAPLMVSSNAPEILLKYPSQSSVLIHQGQGWGSLAETVGIQPPTVEVIDKDDLQF
uniref:F-box domain-containing protein n=1 Tax=Pseudo-nitzschia australis TaxID=44445 RepID=A0A7S4AIU7_9STRA|mmetsp:Transcript_15112/g.32440  ORF Transcript_15112/g.32440 Transcript_15112/m.32440 type:complete len:538 (+) Transcript_15112:95-1708(+)